MCEPNKTETVTTAGLPLKLVKKFDKEKVGAAIGDLMASYGATHYVAGLMVFEYTLSAALDPGAAALPVIVIKGDAEIARALIGLAVSDVHNNEPSKFNSMYVVHDVTRQRFSDEDRAAAMQRPIESVRPARQGMIDDARELAVEHGIAGFFMVAAIPANSEGEVIAAQLCIIAANIAVVIPLAMMATLQCIPEEIPTRNERLDDAISAASAASAILVANGEGRDHLRQQCHAFYEELTGQN